MKNKKCVKNGKNCNNKNKCSNKNCAVKSKQRGQAKPGPATVTLRNLNAAAAGISGSKSMSSGLAASPTAKPAASTTEDAMTTANRIQKSANTFHDMYSRYNTLRELASTLNGLSPAAPLPAGVSVEKIELTFTVAGKTRSTLAADIRTVGEIAPLIASSLSGLIEKMYTEVFSLNNTGAAMQRALELAIVKPSTPNSNDKKD